MSLDKVAHFLAGCVIALALGYVLPPLWGVIAAGVAGALKEFYDHFHPTTHSTEMMDFAVTLAGGAAASAYVFII